MNKYYETMNEALDAVEVFCKANRAVVNEGFTLGSWRNRYASNHALYAGFTSREDFDLLTFRGKETRKRLHVVLYRMDSGRYELTNYIL